MHLPRNLTVLLAAVALPLSLAACSPDNAAEEAQEAAEQAAEAVTPTPAPPAMAPAMVPFTALGGNTASGQAEIAAEGEQTRVTANITGGQPNGVYQGMIHAGTCEAPGAVVIQLQPITAGADGAGQAVSTVAVAPATAMNGQHTVIYHAAGGSPGEPVLCAAIPAHTM
jgi:hypothetical protein